MKCFFLLLLLLLYIDIYIYTFVVSPKANTGRQKETSSAPAFELFQILAY